jgi:hypothetical protein
LLTTALPTNANVSSRLQPKSCFRHVACSQHDLLLNISLFVMPQLTYLCAGYVNNVVVTSRYTWYNFVPLFLFQQFSRFANFYFLIVSCERDVRSVDISTLFVVLRRFVYCKPYRRFLSLTACRARHCHLLLCSFSMVSLLPENIMCVIEMMLAQMLGKCSACATSTSSMWNGARYKSATF